MNKDNITKQLSKELGIKKSKCSAIFTRAFEQAAKELKKRHTVSINGFGLFALKRIRTRIARDKSGALTVFPPRDTIEFMPLAESPADAEFTPGKINSDISIYFRLSIDEAGRITEAIFQKLNKILGAGKSVEIQKFGKFKTSDKAGGQTDGSRIKFVPSKKLSSRVNGNFDNLKKMKIAYPLMPEVKYFEPEFLNGENAHVDVIAETSAAENSKPETQHFTRRKLLSDEVVKLHNEITDSEKKDSASPKNIWR